MEPTPTNQPPQQVNPIVADQAQVPDPTGPTVMQPTPLQPPKRKKPFVKLLAIVLVAMLVIGGGGAAAYFGVVVPNKPENVLKKAMENALRQDELSFDGKLSYESDSASAGGLAAVDITMKGSGSKSKKAGQLQLEVTASGIKVAAEIRYVENNLYIKLGDLTTIKNLLKLQVPENYGPTIDSLEEKISERWVEIDNTLLKQAKLDCIVEATTTAGNDQNIQSLIDTYDNHSFATIKNSTSDTVNGRAAEKFEIDLNDDTMAEYVKELDGKSIFQPLKDCGAATDDSLDTASLADGDTTPLTVWVFKDTKQIARVSSHSTELDYQKDKIKGSGEVTFSYDPVTITKPDDARPVIDVLTELQGIYLDLLGGQAAPSGALPSSLQISDFLSL